MFHVLMRDTHWDLSDFIHYWGCCVIFNTKILHCMLGNTQSVNSMKIPIKHWALLTFMTHHNRQMKRSVSCKTRPDWVIHSQDKPNNQSTVQQEMTSDQTSGARADVYQSCFIVTEIDTFLFVVWNRFYNYTLILI